MISSMRVSINTACAQVVNELRLSGKEVFSADDIKQALICAERGPSSFVNYIGPNGSLAERGYLIRVKGGWELSESSRVNGGITIKVMPANEFLIGEILKTVGDATQKYGAAVEIRAEV